jgi:hypothetical protein
MGLLSKVFKPIKKVFKKIGKGIKSAFKKFGKFMNKLGPLGTIAMGIMLPGIGSVLGGAWSGMAGTLVGSSNAFLSGVGNFMTKAASFGSAVSGTVSNVTGAVTDVLKETFRTVGKNIGLGNVGPKGMKAFFNATDGSLMGNKGLFKRVSESFGDRWSDMSSRWGHFADHMKTSTAQYQGQLASGTYEPYKGYDQSKSMLADKELKEFQVTAEKRWSPEYRAYVDRQKQGILSGLDPNSPEYKSVSDAWQTYEDKIIGLSPTEKKFANIKEGLLAGIDPNSDVGRVLTKQLETVQATNPKAFDLPGADIPKVTDVSAAGANKVVADVGAESVVTGDAVPKTGYEKFMSQVTDPGNIGASVQNTAISTGINYLTAEEIAAQGGYYNPQMYYSQQIAPAENFQSFMDSTIPVRFDTSGYEWGSTPGGGIFGNTFRTLNQPMNQPWTPQNSLMRYANNNNDQTISF